MAEESDLEKTEPASPRKLEQAREEGDVPRSKELATCTILLAGGIAFWVSGERFIDSVNRMLASGLSIEREYAFDLNLLFQNMIPGLIDIAIGLAPIFGILILVALSSPLLIGGWLFSSKALMPKFSRMNPIKGVGNMFSVRSLIELVKAIGKAGLVGIIAWLVISTQIDSMLGLSAQVLPVAAAHMGEILVLGFITIVCALVIIAMIDAPYQMIHYANKLKMTREEVRKESKESEGDPHVKARIRQTQREMARRRMMAEVPTADVVVTNPTHFSVALKYAEGKMKAPIVVAKGADEVAAKIRELAQEHKVPLLEAPPLARALYRHAELGDEIPSALYTAVAEVLAYVFQLRMYADKGGARPEAPSDIPVPPQLDPLNPASNVRGTA